MENGHRNLVSFPINRMRMFHGYVAVYPEGMDFMERNQWKWGVDGDFFWCFRIRKEFRRQYGHQRVDRWTSQLTSSHQKWMVSSEVKPPGMSWNGGSEPKWSTHCSLWQNCIHPVKPVEFMWGQWGVRTYIHCITIVLHCVVKPSLQMHLFSDDLEDADECWSTVSG